MMLIGMLLIFGLALSAFFSGSETGFYRVTRVRLVMDAKDGKRIAQALLWMVNHPSVVVATVLIGNNLANYCISLGGVLLSSRWLAESSRWEFLVPLVATPLVFVYGELLPKYLFFQTPYRLLRWAAPLMMVCTVLFLPLSLFVFAFEAIRGWLSGDSNTITSFALGRQDIQRTIAESHEAGCRGPIQRDLAQNLFSFDAAGAAIRRSLTSGARGGSGRGRQPALDAANRWNSRWCRRQPWPLDRLLPGQRTAGGPGQSAVAGVAHLRGAGQRSQHSGADAVAGHARAASPCGRRWRTRFGDRDPRAVNQPAGG